MPVKPLDPAPTEAALASTGSGERGFTMIELLIAMVVGSIVILAAFGLLRFTTSDVSRITARVRIDQRGRLALEKVMLELHSACVAQKVVPIQEKSSGTELRFISEYSPLNKEEKPIPTSELATVRLRRILYTPPSGKVGGTLIEESWPSTGIPPKYSFNLAETAKKVKLLNAVQAPLSKGKELPVFNYYRYYRSKDAEPVYGQINPTPAAVPLTKAEAESITKVTIGLTVGSEVSESATFAPNDRSVALEDSAIFRLAPASENAGESNLPCAVAE
jgi:prepilin-type N-terminal cleavage/methylation domain-containing protein